MLTYYICPFVVVFFSPFLKVQLAARVTPSPRLRWTARTSEVTVHCGLMGVEASVSARDE